MTDDFLKEIYLKAYNFPPMGCSSKHLAGLRAVRDYYAGKPIRAEAEREWLPPSDGLEMVPAVPTIAMIEAGELALRDCEKNPGERYFIEAFDVVQRVYKAMLACSTSKREGNDGTV